MWHMLELIGLLLTFLCPSQVVCQSKEDQVTVVAAGVTLHEALAAAEQLKKGIDIQYSIVQ